MFAIAADALYATLRRRGTTQQLSGAIVTCVISALLLLPAILWYNLRFSVELSSLAVAEVEVALVYVVLCGWFLPLGATAAYCLFTLPRTSITSVHIPSQKRTTRIDPSSETISPPRRQPGVPVPNVFDEDTPWGWLEHRNGRFQGQRLELCRAIVTIGRGEENDIWLDDDMASRHHAELAWDKGKVYITDCDSLNGVLLNGRRIVNAGLVEKGDVLEIGSHRLLFDFAQAPGSLGEQDDPLAHHAWPFSPHSITNTELPPTRPLEPASAQTQEYATEREEAQSGRAVEQVEQMGQHVNLPVLSIRERPTREWEDTAQLERVTPLPLPSLIEGAFLICNGEMEDRAFLLDRPVITIGRGSESDIVINDASISRRHAQVLRQLSGNYIQDLASRNGSTINGEPLFEPHLLQSGDVVCLGNIRLEYTSVQAARTAPIPFILSTPPLARPASGPTPLRLPSKPRMSQ